MLVGPALRTPVSLSEGYEGLLTGWAQHEVDTDYCAYETVACVTCVTSVHDSIPCDEYDGDGRW